jgi:hypothetical protein
LAVSPARSRSLLALDRVLRARDEVRAAAGRPDDLLPAMNRLASAFTEVTGLPARRRAGESYAGRTIVYEDARRDLRVALGHRLRKAISPALGLLLASARWLAWTVALAYEHRFRQAYERIRNRTGRADVPLARLLSALTADLAFSRQALSPVAASRVTEFQRRWADILRIPAAAAWHRVESATIRREVLEGFACPGARWSAARQHSPDLMIAAVSVDAINRGDFLAVLAETHLGVNTLGARVFVEQSPDPAALVAAEARDHAGTRVVSLPSRQSLGVTSRTYPSALHGPGFAYWTMYPDVTNLPDGIVPAAAMTVADRGDRLEVTCATDGSRYDLLEVAGESLSWMVMNAFIPVAPLPGTGTPRRRPRVTLDSLVIARQSWTVDTARLSWPRHRDGPDRYRAARRWRRESGLPERCFYHLATEDKPQFVDFTSVVLVDLLARGLRRLDAAGERAAVTFTEMLPDVDQAWLLDNAGAHYTSEFRLVAVDARGVARPAGEDTT